MKKTDSITKKLSFRQKSRFLATQQMLHRVVAILVLAFVCSGAWATDYVFVYNGNNYLSNNSGTIANSTSFVPNTCIWTCYNGMTETSLGTSNDNLRSLKNGNNYLNGSTTNGTASSTSASAQQYWRTDDDGYLRYRNSNTYYLYYRGSSWRTSRSTGNDNNGYAGNGWGATDYRATAYTVTNNGTLPAGALSDFTISGGQYITTTGYHDGYSHTNVTRNAACTSYSINGQDYYSTNPANAATTERPQEEVTTGYEWSLSGGGSYASVNTSTGAITVNSIPANDVEMTLTCSNGSKSASMKVILTKSAPVAAGYVIYDGNNHYLGGTSTTAIGSFNPNTCLWTGTSGGKWQNSAGYYLRLYLNTTSVQTNGTQDGTTLTLSGTESGTTGQKVYYDGYNDYYLRYNNGWTQTNTASNSGTNVVFAVTQRHYQGTDPTMPTISAAHDGNIIKFTQTNISGTYAPTYDDYIFYNGSHHYWYNNALVSESDIPATKSSWNPTYTWSIVEGGDYAEINSDGELTFKDAMPTAATTIKVRLTTTNTGVAALDNHTVDYSLTLTPVASQSTLETPVVSCTGISGNSVRTTHTNVTGKYVPAYSTFTIGGQTYKYSGGTIYDNSANLEQDWQKITYSFRVSSGSYSTGGSLIISSTANKTTDVFWKANATASDGTTLSKESVAFPIKVVNSPKVEPTVSFTCSLASDNSGILLTPSLSGNTYTPEYGTVTAGDKTFYFYDGICHTDKLASTDLSSGVSYTWTPTNGTVSTNNILTFSGTSPATVKLTATKGDYSAESATTNFTLTEEDPAPEAIAPDIVVTPKTATLGITNQPSLGYSNTQEFSIPESLEAVVKTVPAHTKIVSGTNTYYKHADGKYYSSTPAATSESQTLDFTSATWTASEEGYVTINPNGRTAIVVYDGKPVGDDNTRISITANATYGEATKSGRAIVSLLYSYIDVTGITATDKNMFIGENDKVSLTITPNNNDAGIVYENFTYTVADESIATIDANGTIHGVSPGTTTVTVTYSDADKPDHPALRTPKSATGASTTFTVTVGIKAPTININDDGTFTITDNNVSGSDATIKYTTDGSDPVANGTTGTSGTVTTGQTVKAVAIKGEGTSKASTVASEFYAKSGVSGGTVVLNDYEDHTWTYYSGVDTSVDGGHYNNTYIAQGTGTKREVKMYSPNPRNVKITYQGNGGEVSINEDETEFVYYETIEKIDDKYTYQVISNPFSKRPTGKGFGGWKLKSMTTGASIGYAVNATLPLDAELTLTLPDAGVNGTSAEIVFEATWVDATIVKDKTSGLSSSGTYETNLIVLTKDYSNNIAPDYPCTIMMVEPDGSSDYRTKTFSGNITPANLHDTGKTTKIEFAHWTPGNNINPQGRNFTIGRGMVMDGTARTLYGTNTNATINHVLKVESGKYSGFYNYGTDISSGYLTKQWVTFGCDYDRAKGDNSKLEITGTMYITSGKDVHASSGQEVCRVYSKSGKFVSGQDVGTATAEQSYYFGFSNKSADEGYKYLEIQGGEWCNIAGGMGTSNNTNDPCTTIRMKGGTVRGSIYGAAQYSSAKGTRLLVFTGGTIKGWIAGGANGTQDTGGLLTGSSYVYVGGNTQVNSNGSTTLINRGTAGNVFGAGCGWTASSDAGKVSEGTNVVIADNAYVERGVYGGGSFGYCATDKTSYVYVTGGHVGGKAGGVNTGNSSASYTTDVKGGVYGGASKNQGGTVILYMTGGLVEGGVYGGSNASGTLSGSVTMQINGGQVGTEDKSANIHGGGYGQSTQVSKDVVITLGKESSARDAEGVLVYGDVYGGSALGSVNGTTARDTYHTYVTMNAGYIHGSLYGGALGNSTTAANVYGPVQVKVYGGSVMKTDENGANGSGAVYGANNINGAPQRAVTVDIYGTNSAPAEGEYALFSVYGGGNAANYTYGNGYPKVTVHNCDNSIEYVYGGGNAAAVASTDVTIYGGDKIGNVFGGGNGTVTAANVAGAANVTIHGGTILNVFGGSNSQGTIGGTINVNVAEQAESGHDLCPINIDNVFGGGNLASSAAATMNIGCATHIGAVYGGANQANITSGNIDLKIAGGNIDNVFGGNNISGTISGTIKVTVNEDKTTYPCGMVVGNVFGAGNLAAYTGSPTVNIENGHLTGSVFGGGKGDATDESHATGAVTGNPQVTIGDTNNSHKVIIDGNVFGGGDAANVQGKPVVLVKNCNTVIGTFSDDAGTIDGTVYGGGNAAHITGEGNGTNVTINGGTIYRVFGGGNGEVKPANIAGDAVTNIHAGLIGQVFAGSNEQGSVGGTASATIDHDNTDCNEKIDEVYGGGNLAAGNAGAITVECGAIIGDLYGGANQANVTSDITLNITGGTIDRVFGGNNTSGNVMGSIIVNVQKDPTCDLDLGSVFGGGNQAAYSIYGYNTDGSAITSGTPTYSNPQVNIKNGTVKNNVYGGGLGETAKVYGAPQVTIGDNTNTDWVAAVGGDVYGGGDAAEVVGTPVVNVINKCNTTIANVYGGGNAADVSGTDVNIDGGTITGMVFGGGHGSKGDSSAEPAIPAVAANVNGNVNLDVTGGTISKVFAGSNANGNITGTVLFNINKVADHCDMKIDEVYGGGNEAAGNAATINIGCTGGEGEYIHTVYGGANAADINNNIVLNINGGHIDNVFGGNNTSGAVAGTITVNVDQAESTTDCNSYLGNVYGAGNLALYTGNPAVNILNGIVSGNVYGAGKGDATDESHAPGTVTGNPLVTIGDDVAEHTVTILGNVFGGGDAANVVGTPSVTVNDCATTIGTRTTTEGVTTYTNGTVYGGGNAAHITGEGNGTAVTINGGTINRIFGGGNGETKAANVAGDANTVIHAGNIHQAFAGSNAAGVISGEANITVDHDGTCNEHLDEVYGGGNLAEGNAGTVTIECGADVGDVYGGANQANVTNDITLNITGGQINRVFGGNNTSGNISGSITVNIEIDETACTTASLNSVYGAGNQAAYKPTTPGAYPAVNLKKGTVAQNVYGGGLGASATVTSNPTVTLEGVTVNGAIFGGGDAAPVTGNPTVVANYGKSANIFGGGKGETAIVTGGTHVTINQTEGKTLSVVNVFGGGDAAAVAGSGTTLIDMKAGTVANIYGGGNQAGAASTTVNMTGGTVEKTGGATSSGIYGGCNTSGTVTGNIAVNITGGTVGTAPESETPAVESNVHGGGYGSATATNGNVTVIVNGEAVNIWGDVYGGSALGNVNDAATDQTKVQLDNGTIHGCLYGGGLGDADNAALVNGTVNVIVNGGTVTEQVFGCNNVNGTPKSNVTVTINGTNAHTPATETTPAVYAISEVYGGGNMAHYAPNGSEVCKVIVNNCESSIGYVYGGGNAANVTSTDVTINGGIIGQVFGGGHGNKDATPATEANVSGNVAVKVYGGTINQVFAGSNSKGNIGGTATLTVNKNGTCAMYINEVYGGGNEAKGNAGSVNIGCTGGEGEGIQDVYGGARNADVTSGITLNITGGNLNRVFGGNNVGGNVTGAIKVNINEDGSACGMNLNTVYGAGNMAAYTPTDATGAYPEVNIIKGTVKQNVYGGGLGSTAVVTSNPVVNIKGGTVTQDVFGGGQAANVAGSTAINVISGTVSRDLYGGGALADVTGNTVVSLTGGTVNNVYGGGLGDASTAALINGGTTVTLNGSVVKGSVFGCNNVNGTPKGHVEVLVQKTTAQPDAAEDAYHVAAVYGGGNQAAYLPTSDTDFTEVLVSGCDNSVEYVYGGGNAASTPKTQVTIEGGKMFNVFGGGNGAGAGNPGADVGYKNHDTSNTYGEGTTNVNIYGGTITSVFGGSNTKGNIRVQSNVNLDDHGECPFQVGDVYGAGNEAEMYGNGNLIIGCIPGLEEIYGGAKNADIHGDVSLTITNGEFGKVFGGNNLGGNIAGSITVNIEETGCRPIKIGELYGGGNLAAYTAPVGKTMYPEVNIKSFTTIGTVFGGGLGMTDAQIDATTKTDWIAAAKKLSKTDEQIAALSDADLKALAKTYFKSRGVIKGNPHVNIGLVEGKFANGGTYETIDFPAISNKWGNKLGTIGDVYGGGNAADIDGDTYVNIATTETVTLTTGENKNPQPLKGVNISGNVYGGGNAAHVTGKTHVQVGKAPTPTPAP